MLSPTGHNGRLKIDANETIQPKTEGWRIIKINDDGTILNCEFQVFTSADSYVYDDTEYVLDIHDERIDYYGNFITGDYVVTGVVLDSAGNIAPFEPIRIIDGVVQ